MTTQAAPPQVTSPSLPSPWILGPVRDLLLFVASPVLILLAVMGLRQGVASKDIQYMVLAFGAMGHNLPGMMRAYGDRDLFRRFKTRFIVSPIVLLAICFAFTWKQSGAIILIAYVWAVWHALMQIYGFLRIYDARVGAVERVNSRVDFAMCIAWFGGAVVFSDARLYLIQSLVAGFGIAPLSPESLQVLRHVVMGVIAITTVAYIWNQVSRKFSGLRVSPIKNLLYVTSISFWWYAHVYTADVLLGLIMFEIFHDVQYLAIVWIFNRRRVESGAKTGSVTRFIFRNSWGMIGLYVGLCFVYGGFIPASASVTATPLLAALAATIIQTSGMLHYYYDGFIWKVREASTRKGLGVDGGAGRADSVVSWHGAKWLLLIIPAAAMWVAGDRPPSLDTARALARSTPNAAEAQFELGVQLNEARLHVESLPVLERSLAITPGEPEVEKNLALARLQAGKQLLADKKDARAKVVLQQAYESMPMLADQAVSRGLSLWQSKMLPEAILSLRAALVMRANDPRAHLNLALAYRDSGRRDLALSHAKRGAALLPMDAKAQMLVRELERH